MWPFLSNLERARLGDVNELALINAIIEGILLLVPLSLFLFEFL